MATSREPFEVRRFPHDVIMIREADDREEVACYLVVGSRDVAVIDTGLGGGGLRAVVERLTPNRPVVLQTHLHWDHIGGSGSFPDVRAHRIELTTDRAGWPWEPPGAEGSDLGAEGPRANEPRVRAHVPDSGALQHGDRIDLGARWLDVVHVPGHSPGSVAFLDRDARLLFVGDLCYLGQMLLFVSGSDLGGFRRSLHALAAIVGDVDAIYPAHGSSPITGEDVLAMRDGFDRVWDGRQPDWHGAYAGHRVAIHDFGRFAFLVPPE